MDASSTSRQPVANVPCGARRRGAAQATHRPDDGLEPEVGHHAGDVRRAHRPPADPGDRRVLEAHRERGEERQPEMGGLAAQVADRVPVDEDREGREEDRLHGHRQHVDRRPVPPSPELGQEPGEPGPRDEHHEEGGHVGPLVPAPVGHVAPELRGGPGHVARDLTVRQDRQDVRVPGDPRERDREARLLAEGVGLGDEHAGGGRRDPVARGGQLPARARGRHISHWT